MANIKKIEGKTGLSYKITVTKGRDLNGKQIRHYKTWTPPQGMSEKKAEKEAQRVAFAFENEIELGYQADNRQTFAEYAEYVLELKERTGIKYRTLERYRELLQRIYPAIGHIKLSDLRPQHLNTFYKKLGEPGVSSRGDRAKAAVDLPALIKSKGYSRARLTEEAGVSAATITTACKRKNIELATADAIAKVLGRKTQELFTVSAGAKQLSSKTVLEYHRLIRTILAQAEKEMLVPYNAASKATPPKAAHKEVNYFQVEDIVRIRDALEQEPLKWKVATHLLLITGCRRGEVMGLRWSRVDFEASQIKIDTNLLYAPKRGIYEDTTKTGTVRFIKLPPETMELLRQYRRWYLEQRLKAGDRCAFRHTMASVLISNGKDIVAVSKRLGHAKVSTTTDIYSHIIQQADEQASECLADVMLRPMPKQKRTG